MPKTAPKESGIFEGKNVDIFMNKRIIMFCMDTLIKRDPMVAADHLRSGDHSFIVGARQLRKALARGSVGRVFLARDADPTITAPLEELSHQHGVECLLGGQDVPTLAAPAASRWTRRLRQQSQTDGFLWVTP